VGEQNDAFTFIWSKSIGFCIANSKGENVIKNENEVSATDYDEVAEGNGTKAVASLTK
jgi:hypothetical protein